jgi:hypothetical protein
MHDVGRFLNRLLGLPPDIQNRLFELFTSILDVLVHNARIEGSFDSGIVDMKANSVELLSTPKTVHVDQMSGASTMLFTFTLDRGVTWEVLQYLSLLVNLVVFHCTQKLDLICVPVCEFNARGKEKGRAWFS